MKAGHPTASRRFPLPLAAVWLAALAAALAGACSKTEPRSYDLFIDDAIARDGVLARCDKDPVAARGDIECANARRAALAVQLLEERARREQLERESAAKLEALRREMAAQQAAREAEAAAAREAEAAAAWSASAEPGEAAAGGFAGAGAGTPPLPGDEVPPAAIFVPQAGAEPAPSGPGFVPTPEREGVPPAPIEEEKLDGSAATL